jgi:hypothetical protein
MEKHHLTGGEARWWTVTFIAMCSGLCSAAPPLVAVNHAPDLHAALLGGIAALILLRGRHP